MIDLFLLHIFQLKALMDLNKLKKQGFIYLMEKFRRTRWGSIVIAITFTIILVNCTSKGIEPHPTSSPPNETMMAEQSSKPAARISGTETMSTPNFQLTI